MANPLIYGGSQPNKATAPSAAVNTLAPAVARQKNTFYNPQQVLQTERYSDIMPFFVMDCVPNDDIQMKSNIDLRPYSSFKSPMMSQVNHHRAAFAVPKSVIYPRLWSKIFVNPKKGDDVNFDNVKVIFPFWEFRTFLEDFVSVFSAKDDNNITLGQSYAGVSMLFSVMSVASQYSLLPYLGLNAFKVKVSGASFSQEGEFTFEKFVTYLYNSSESLFTDLYIVFNVNEISTVSFKIISENVLDYHQLELAYKFYLLHSLDANEYFTAQFSLTDKASVDGITYELFYPLIFAFANSYREFSSLPDLNIERVVAYQMGMSQFFTSDDVDDIFTAELWYQNMDGLAASILSSTEGFPRFTYNGTELLYEPYSSQVFHFLFDLSGDVSVQHVCEYVINLFAPASSLRYGDMFNASRLQPLAVGDVNAPVSSNSVSAVDMTKATLMQRFLNAVNSVRNTIRGYAAMLYGVVPDDVPIEPKFVAHIVKPVGSSMVANTAGTGDVKQGNLTTNLVLHDSSNFFDIHINQDTILIGVSWFDVLAAYPSPTEAFGFHVDRFDDFNPMLQNIGDVPVNSEMILSHLIGPDNSDTPSPVFGYLQNDFEYKQSISRAIGAYVSGFLPSWAFVRDIKYYWELYGDLEFHVNSSFIRANYAEWDSFYSSLTGFGVDYFHFVCSYVNEVTASRPMNFVSGVLFNSAL